MFDPRSGFFNIASIIFIINFAMILLGVYGIILFIRLGHKGLKALDIYIDNNRKDKQ